jgi:hypothetical protein
LPVCLSVCRYVIDFSGAEAALHRKGTREAMEYQRLGRSDPGLLKKMLAAGVEGLAAGPCEPVGTPASHAAHTPDLSICASVRPPGHVSPVGTPARTLRIRLICPSALLSVRRAT